MIGPRTRLAREACGLTQQKLADRAGISQGALSQIEAGRVFEPSSETIEAIAAVTGFPLSFFLRGPLPDLPEGNYRKFARGTSRAEKKVRALTRHMVEIVQSSEGVLRLPNVGINAVPDLSGIEEIESQIYGVRESLGVGAFDPIPNLIRAIERAGVVVLRLLVEMDDHDGFSVWPSCGLDDARPIIVLTGDNPGDRDRFTTAHELGHLILHSVRRDITPAQAEAEANRFAGALLLPKEAASETLKPPITLDVLKAAKATYGVSMAALTMRALDLQIISRRRRESLFKQLSRRGWRTEEPVIVPLEQPILISQIIDTLSGAGSKIERAERLGMSVFAFRGLTPSAPLTQAPNETRPEAATDDNAVLRIREGNS